MGERGRYQAFGVDLADPVGAFPGEQGAGFDERQSVLDGAVVGGLDAGGEVGVGDRPQRRDGLDRREGQVVPGDGLGFGAGVFGDLPGQLPGVHRLPAVLGDEELPPHGGANPGALLGRDGPVAGQPGALVDPGDLLGHLQAERAHVTGEYLVRRPEPGHALVVVVGQVRALQLLASLLG